MQALFVRSKLSTLRTVCMHSTSTVLLCMLVSVHVPSPCCMGREDRGQVWRPAAWRLAILHYSHTLQPAVLAQSWTVERHDKPRSRSILRARSIAALPDAICELRAASCQQG
ncbi:hypothetical protein CC85DRAFT_43854 [Cutaneotrichosporon oleaginosum]|uniref:Uncharacterized protein n=1 Tax=Cutaneotrichosporon oleaginosum TaxID=879819 RepID=A0A0J1ASF1_9TREE|nr:uncharacterized protein CC85DRAFT_43854 [Cutaneotrichosporon oleaginosum]KLT38284.1 hypothetical protein CC85DRAFT_43854 [Cutaneotrichosporon oleaginosum]TXT11312.1 hypothetical protein COLE_01722 [Cutaneotrichosporon oleaginosum]